MKFSLVIPAAPERSVEILESIKKQDYPRSEFHVVIIRGKNPSNNRNRGAEKSRGEIIAFLDDDAILEKDYLKRAEEFFKKHKDVDIVGGPQLTPKDEKGFAKISGYAFSSKFGAWKLAGRYSEVEENLDVDETVITSANLLCRRCVMERVKFDPSLFPGEDPKFISDAKKEGFKIAYSPNIILYHRRRANVKGLSKQIFNYGKVRPAKERFVDTLKMPFFFVPSIFLIYLVLLLAMVLVNPSITGNAVSVFGEASDTASYWSLVLFTPLIVYILLAIAFSIHDSTKNKDFTALFVLPFIYPIIHISYGAGMIWGYLKK